MALQSRLANTPRSYASWSGPGVANKRPLRYPYKTLPTVPAYKAPPLFGAAEMRAGTHTSCTCLVWLCISLWSNYLWTYRISGISSYYSSHDRPALAPGLLAQAHTLVRWGFSQGRVVRTILFPKGSQVHAMDNRETTGNVLLCPASWLNRTGRHRPSLYIPLRQVVTPFPEGTARVQ